MAEKWGVEERGLFGDKNRKASQMNCGVCDLCVLYELMKNDLDDTTWPLTDSESGEYTTYTCSATAG